MAKEIPLTHDQLAIVDDEDYERISAFNWHALIGHNNWYARRTFRLSPGGTLQTVHMHRVILNAPDGMEVDHRNGNGLDNQKHNLRMATTSQNQANARRRKDNASGFKGVYQKTPGRWCAAIRENGRHVHIGYFDTPVAAACAYDQRAFEVHGTFARLNFALEAAKDGK